MKKTSFGQISMSILHYLLYGTPDSTLPELLPIDIVFKENL